jgi:GNAT superfamily N-acetyltransferase
MHVTFQRARAKDAAALVKVQRLAFAEEAARYGERPPYEEEADLADLIETALVYKILVAGRCVGDIVVRPKDDGSYYLRTISVVPAFQRPGIGSQAMAFLIGELPDARGRHLVTPAGRWPKPALLREVWLSQGQRDLPLLIPDAHRVREWLSCSTAPSPRTTKWKAEAQFALGPGRQLQERGRSGRPSARSADDAIHLWTWLIWR